MQCERDGHTEALTTAAGSKQTYTVTNSLVSSSSQVYVTVQNGTNTIGPVVATNVVPGSGSFAVDLWNLHASSSLDGTLKLQITIF